MPATFGSVPMYIAISSQAFRRVHFMQSLSSLSGSASFSTYLKPMRQRIWNAGEQADAGHALAPRLFSRASIRIRPAPLPFDLPVTVIERISARCSP